MKVLKRTNEDKYGDICMAVFFFGMSAIAYRDYDSMLRVLVSGIFIFYVALALASAIYKFRTPFISLVASDNYIFRHKFTATVDDIADVFYHKKAGMHYGYFEVHFRNRKPLKVSSGTKIKHHECVCDFFIDLKIPVHNFVK